MPIIIVIYINITIYIYISRRIVVCCILYVIACVLAIHMFVDQQKRCVIEAIDGSIDAEFCPPLKATRLGTNHHVLVTRVLLIKACYLLRGD